MPEAGDRNMSQQSQTHRRHTTHSRRPKDYPCLHRPSLRTPSLHSGPRTRTLRPRSPKGRLLSRQSRILGHQGRTGRQCFCGGTTHAQDGPSGNSLQARHKTAGSDLRRQPSGHADQAGGNKETVALSIFLQYLNIINHK